MNRELTVDAPIASMDESVCMRMSVGTVKKIDSLEQNQFERTLMHSSDFLPACTHSCVDTPVSGGFTVGKWPEGFVRETLTKIKLVRFMLAYPIQGVTHHFARSGAYMRNWTALVAVVVALAWSDALAVTINTSNVASADYIAFTTGATVQNFESVSGLTPLSITAYTNGTPVPPNAQMHGQIPNLFFHSGGANPNNPVANPGTPVGLLTLAGGIAGNAHSGTNVVAPLQIMTDPTSPAVLGLAAGNFLEIIFSSPVNRAGVWLNPALGNVTFNALDASLSGITGGSTTGNAGNFVGVSLPTDSIKVVSIIATQASGFTIDDLTFGTAGAATPNAIPEPSTLLLLGPIVLALVLIQRRALCRSSL